MPALELHLYSFVTVMLTGVVVSLAFDLVRGIRRRLTPPGVVAELLDYLYWGMATALLGVGIFLANRGELRLYVLLGLGVGGALYFTLASPVLLWAVEMLLGALVLVMGWLVAGVQMLVVRPLLWVAARLLQLARALASVGRNLVLWLVRPLRPAARRIWLRVRARLQQSPFVRRLRQLRDLLWPPADDEPPDPRPPGPADD